MEQDYALYTSGDQEVWQILFDRQIDNLAQHACIEYIEALNEIGFSNKEIPDFKEINRRLKAANGWQLSVVPGLIPAQEFFTLLSQKKFCASTWIRKKCQIDYLKEPDMFHDVFGHVPLLLNKVYSDFFERIGQLGLKYIDNASILEKLTRLYWFTIEFGLLEDKEGLKIYGAGIISSPQESIYSTSSKPLHKPFNLAEILETPFRNDIIQTTYFVAQSFDQIFNSLEELDVFLAYQMEGANY